MRTRGAVIAALLSATLIRVAAMPLPGTEDVGTWKIWAYAAASRVTHVYGAGGTPPVRGVLRWGTRETTVDYPPVAMYELALVGRLYRTIDPGFSDSALLTAAVKLPGLLCGLGLTALLAATVRRLTGSPRAAAWVALAYWLNPATALNAEVLGYLDPLMMLPAIAALVLVHAGAAESAGIALAIAALTKPQGILLVPACMLAAWHVGRLPLMTRLAAGGALASAALVLPFALAGALPNMWLAFGSFYARRDILSGYAANAWWIVNYVVRAYYQVPRLGFPRAFLVPVQRVMAISTLQEVGFPNPRPLALSAVLGTWAWALWRARASNALAVHALLGAFMVHAFFVLGVGVHEHHMMLAVPLLALAGALRPSVRPLFYAVSLIVALNLNLFYGISRGWGWSVPRLLLVVDMTVLLSVANIAALLWHGRVLVREGRV